MRIALAFPGCHRRGGVERVMFECSRYLALRGHEVTVFASKWEPVDHPNLRFRHVQIRRQPWFLQGSSFFRECSRRYRSQDFDVLGSHGCVAPLGGVYWAQSVHAAWLEASRRLRPWWSAGCWRQKLNPLHPVLLRLEKRHFSPGGARRIVALTPQVRSDLEQWYGVPSENVTTVNIGFSPEEFHPAFCEGLRRDARAKFGYGPKDRVVVFVANELERKGFPQLLRAISLLEDPSIKLIAVGRLSTARYASEIRAYGMDGRVHFTGPADPRIGYAAGDVFVLPTQYEAWGLVIVEALACGLPVLTSRLAGASVAVNAMNGDLLEDPLSVEEIALKLRALIDRSEVDRTSIAASVAHFRWECVLEEYERVLESAAGTTEASKLQ